MQQNRVNSTLRACTAELCTVVTVALLLQGCYCVRFQYASFEDQSDFHIVERSIRFPNSQIYTFPPVTTRYEVARSLYRLEVRTAYPLFLDFKAFDWEGNALEIAAQDGSWRTRRPVPFEKSAATVAFDVSREGKKIGSETVHYEIGTRRFVCDLAWE